MTPIEALELALAKEEDAIKLYKDLAVKHTAIKDLLISLSSEEQKHRKLIQEKIAELKRY